MTIYQNTVDTPPSMLDRRFGLGRITGELLLYGLLFFVSIGLHLWQLDHKAMHHDESIHAWMSYKFYSGTGSFPCADPDWTDSTPPPDSPTYCYNPVYHGPTLYMLTLLAYLLFGAGDAQARLPMAAAGIALVPMAWTLRSFIGRRGALIAAVLLTVSPSILYYTRFARHDALVLLWSMFLVVGLFNWLRDGGAFNLSLAAAGVALTWATHELVFILLFIFGSFLLLRLLWEWRPRLFFAAMGGALVLSGIVMLLAALVGAQSPTLDAWLQRLLGPMEMLAIGAVVLLPMALSWERAPIVRERILGTWRNDRRVYWTAGATFLVLFTLLFTVFFAQPRGFLDGWYQGLNYWLLSQHEAARGGQPWFYYLMLLPIYELLPLIFALTGLVWLMWGGLKPWLEGWKVGRLEGAKVNASSQKGIANSDAHAKRMADGQPSNLPTFQPSNEDSDLPTFQPPLLVNFLAYWFALALVGFSWAGEKMPWLLTHITLPAVLLAAWVLGLLIARVPWRELRHDWGWAVAPLALLLVSCVGVAAFSFAGGDATVGGIQSRLRGLIPLLVAGGCMFALLTIAGQIGSRLVWRLSTLAVAGVLLLYTVRATTLVNFRYPDTPIEPLVYTQTAPDVPILVRQIEQIALNETRADRTAQDPTGGHSLPIVLDSGSASGGGEGSVAWPMQWYMRDYQDVRWIDPTSTPAFSPDAAVVVLSKQHVTPEVEAQLEADWVRTSEGVFNWWFPEFTASNPEQPDQVPAVGYKSLAQEGPLPVLAWPLNPSNWSTLWNFMVYRKLPMELDGREMVVYMRRDVVPGGGTIAAAAAPPPQTLTAAATLASGELDNPRGMAVDGNGNVYIADTNHHRIVVVGPNGATLRTFGSLGNGDGEFNEPSGVSVDGDGNVYVADTWNARIVKFAPDGSFVQNWGSGAVPYGDPFTAANGRQVNRLAFDTDDQPEINAANPLGFFGPRNVLIRGERAYIADTGNSRIVVTDLDGNFVQQWGSVGGAAGQLREPIGLTADQSGRLFVGDTWNGRVQVFQLDQDGQAQPLPIVTFPVASWAANTYNDPFIAAMPDGRLWVAQGARNTLGQYDAAGTLLRTIKAEPALNGPKGVALSPDGAQLYVVNSGGGEVLELRIEN